MTSPSLLVRRTHMYLALFLFPWMLMYALSTIVMNHRAWILESLGPPAGWVKERTFVYDGSFSDEDDAGTVARQILSTAGLDGSHTVSRRKDGAIVIARNDLLAPRRLTYSPSDRTVVVERLPSRANTLLERFHRRRGYATGYATDTTWAVTVDVAIAAMVFWALSGLWMWWEMKVTRRFGAIAFLAGTGLFALFLMTL
jgi:hypothetical protein